MSVIVGLTGQSGAGKTTISNVFEASGFYIINCDLVAREAVEPNTECFDKLKEKFPQLFDGNFLDRKKAGKILFSNKKLLEEYNSVIFPYILKLLNSKITRAIEQGKEYILLDAPTLFEAGADKLCDVIVSCIARQDIRLKRIIERDRLDRDTVVERFNSQPDDDFFIKNSDYIIENNTTVLDAEALAYEIIDKIKERY